jgi:SAM-dependent methyltransferase
VFEAVDRLVDRNRSTGLSCIDSDEVKLGLARQAAAARGMDNVEFRMDDATDWDEPGGYDLVYSRFLLQHLSEPVSLLRRMWAAVAGGGVLIVEDAGFDGWCCDPPDDGLRCSWTPAGGCWPAAARDHAIGRKLYRYFLAAEIPEPRVGLVQPVHHGEAKTLAWSTLDATADAILADGLATPGKAHGRAAEPARFHRRSAHAP